MPIHYEKRGHIAHITIDNGRLNLMQPGLHREMFGHLEEFIADDEVRVGILAGAEGRSFCAGDDLKVEIPERTKKEVLEAHLYAAKRHSDPPGRPGWDQDTVKLERFKPMVGAVDYYCLGQGLIYLLLLTDIRFATPRAEFGLPEVAYGMGGIGGLTRIGRQVPHTAAMWMMLTGERVGAERAREWSLVNEVVAPEDLFAAAHAAAEKIAQIPPLSIRVEMEAYQRGMDLSRHDSLALMGHFYRMQALGGGTEGITPAFMRKKE